MASQLNITANRQQRKWTRKEQFVRLAWGLGQVLFRLSPRPFWSWRRILLRAFGAHVGAQVHIYPTVKIVIPWTLRIGDHTAVGDGAILYGLGPLTLGRRVTVSQGAHLCGGTHDWRDPTMPLIKSSITVEDDAWICTDAFVGPGVTVGQGCIVGARTVVMRDVPAYHVARGNPAQASPKSESAK